MTTAYPRTQPTAAPLPPPTSEEWRRALALMEGLKDGLAALDQAARRLERERSVGPILVSKLGRDLHSQLDGISQELNALADSLLIWREGVPLAASFPDRTVASPPFTAKQVLLLARGQAAEEPATAAQLRFPAGLVAGQR